MADREEVRGEAQEAKEQEDAVQQAKDATWWLVKNVQGIQRQALEQLGIRVKVWRADDADHPKRWELYYLHFDANRNGSFRKLP